jgi:hypothetical protein
MWGSGIWDWGFEIGDWGKRAIGAEAWGGGLKRSWPGLCAKVQASEIIAVTSTH